MRKKAEFHTVWTRRNLSTKFRASMEIQQKYAFDCGTSLVLLVGKEAEHGAYQRRAQASPPRSVGPLKFSEAPFWILHHIR